MNRFVALLALSLVTLSANAQAKGGLDRPLTFKTGTWYAMAAVARYQGCMVGLLGAIAGLGKPVTMTDFIQLRDACIDATSGVEQDRSYRTQPVVDVMNEHRQNIDAPLIRRYVQQ